MSSADGSKPAARSGRRNKKGQVRRQKSDSTHSATPIESQTPEQEQEQLPRENPQPAVTDPLEAVVAEAMVTEPEAHQAGGPSPAEADQPEASPVSLQTIANAYRDYTRKSFVEFGAFCEQLSGVRSLDKAMEVQTEFVRRAYEHSVAESRKIRELHGKLAWQTFEPFQGLPDKTPESREKS